MSSFTPRLEIYPSRIEENARSVINLCHSHGIKVAGVTKVICAHPAVVGALEKAGVDILADSRLENLNAIRETGSTLPLMLLRIPTPSRLAEVVELADISLNSSLETMIGLSKAAVKAGKTHQVILMIDVGDLREGIWPDRALEVVTGAANLPNLDVLGLGCNLACYGGVIPTTEKMEMLLDVHEKCQKSTGLPLEIISGGNSANLPLLAAGGIPAGINQLRIGEAIQLGRNVLDRSPWPGTRQDTYRIVAEVVEMEVKPSVPIGMCGRDAFGDTPQFTDRGLRKRAICNLGRQDVVVDNIEPVDPGLIVLGGSSDHLIVDVQEAAEPVKVGSEIAFYPGYSALLAASTSAYVQKVVVD